MAGMLPGVECARRRRFHQGGLIEAQNLVGHGGTRHSSFCLYTSNNEIHLNSSSSRPRKASNQSSQVDKLEGAAKEAKDRLDERLRTPKKSEPRRNSNKGSMKSKDGGVAFCSTILLRLQTEVFGLKRSNSKRFSWVKFTWRASKQDECAVCLDRFKAGETLINLPCAHRFHSRCLVPWLESSSHCPCCRTKILS